MRQRDQLEAVTQIAWKAQCRLNQRFWQLVRPGKLKQQAVVAIARELLAFIWEIAQMLRQSATPTLLARLPGGR